MTIYEWRKLKPGDMVWVLPTYFNYPILGYIKIKRGKKSVWLNLFGDAQFVWKPSDMEIMLNQMSIYIPHTTAAFTVGPYHYSRGCTNCRFGIFFKNNRERWCTMRMERPTWADRCMFWKPSKKYLKNNTENT